MPTGTKNSQSHRLRGVRDAEIARLKAENIRLRAKIRALHGRTARPTEIEALPALPGPNSDGNYPAAETLNVIVARQVIRRRRQAGWSQAELARRAGVRQETVSRIESGKHAPTVTTVDKLDRVLREAGV